MRSARRSVACWLNTPEASAIKGTGVGGRLTREDVEKHSAKGESKAPAAEPAAQPAWARARQNACHTRLRKRVVERLLEAKILPPC